jgi:hypothetical protein
MRSRNEIELDAVEMEMGRKADEVKDIWARLDQEERGSTPEEVVEVDRLYRHITNVLEPRQRELEDAIAVEHYVKDIARKMGREERQEEKEEPYLTLLTEIRDLLKQSLSR